MRPSLLDTGILSEFLRGNAKINKVIPLILRMGKTAATIQADLRKKGTEIGHTDTLIAHIAIVSELQLVTNNTNHFKRIKGLEIINWMK